MTVTIQTRGDIAANWQSANPILATREMGLETDTQRFKVGDNVTNWNDLPYWGSGASRIMGEMTMWPTDTPPTDWLLCDGQAVSRTIYSGLFAAVGTTFGAGDGSTTFNLPDMRGRLPLGLDNMGGSSANRVTDAQADLIGGSGGAETHTLTTTEMPSHSHRQYMTMGGPGGNTTRPASGGGATPWGTIWVENAGGGAAHENMPCYLTLNYIIYAGA
ncbi:MAG: tail fiber protein [Nitrospiria bacterium]